MTDKVPVSAVQSEIYTRASVTTMNLTGCSLQKGLGYKINFRLDKTVEWFGG